MLYIVDIKIRGMKMRFNLEPGGAFCDGKNKLVTVKINDEEKINLSVIV
ncbi:hypothetical protein wCauBTS_13580 [Wolbachia pipientis]|nr:hypothetical protein wHmt_12240 [Wolbachia pipientis]BDG78052.1 hypothetical protein wHmc_11840 [Wolbachia pipientis]